MNHQEYQELVALHALDALDASDARALEEHLETCAQCRAELIDLRDAAGLLVYAATPAEPRAELRDRILANVHTSKKADLSAAKTSPQVSSFSDRRQSVVWPNLLKMAAAIAIGGLLIGILVLWRRDVRLQREIAQLSRQLNTQQRELTRDKDVLARQREVLHLLNAPGAKKMELSGTPTAQTARATFVFDPQTGHAMLMTEGLPATPADKAYELWFIPKGRSPMAGKMFTVDSSGRAMVSQEMPPEALENAVVAITLEPKNGSAVPTGAIYLSSPSS